jgi:hypothetical protein
LPRFMGGVPVVSGGALVMTSPPDDAKLIERLRLLAPTRPIDGEAADRISSLIEEAKKYNDHIMKIDRALLAAHEENERLKGENARFKEIAVRNEAIYNWNKTGID